MNNSDILYVKEGPIAKITLNRPNKMNSYTVEMNDFFKRSVMNASKDKNIRVIIITGTGRAFCSGADVKTLRDLINLTPTICCGMYCGAAPRLSVYCANAINRSLRR